MRVKSQWFNSGRSKTPVEIAGAVAFTSWRIAENALKEMRSAGYDIDIGPQYFSFLSEFLIFLVQLADRIAYRNWDEQERIAFTIELANRVAQNLADNYNRLLDGDAVRYKAGFIERLNSHAEEYSRYEYEPNAENFSFIRCLGLYMQDVVEEHDKHWVIDQTMAIQAPEAIETLEKAMRGYLGQEPKRRRTGASGE